MAAFAATPDKEGSMLAVECGRAYVDVEKRIAGGSLRLMDPSTGLGPGARLDGRWRAPRWLLFVVAFLALWLMHGLVTGDWTEDDRLNQYGFCAGWVLGRAHLCGSVVRRLVGKMSAT